MGGNGLSGLLTASRALTQLGELQQLHLMGTPSLHPYADGTQQQKGIIITKKIV